MFQFFMQQKRIRCSLYALFSLYSFFPPKSYFRRKKSDLQTQAGCYIFAVLVLNEVVRLAKAWYAQLTPRPQCSQATDEGGADVVSCLVFRCFSRSCGVRKKKSPGRLGRIRALFPGLHARREAALTMSTMGPVFSKGFCCVLIFSWSEYYTSSDSGGEGKSKQAEKYGAKKSKERREEPLGKCLTRPVPNGRALLAVLYFPSCHVFPPVWTFPRPYSLPLGLRG